MAGKWIDRDLGAKAREILLHAETYHKKYYLYDAFSGPDLYFHKRALSVEYEKWQEKIEMIYAALVSWGMHRMGTNGPKMQSFDSFEKSMSNARDKILGLQHSAPQSISLSEWETLEQLFKEIKVMSSGTTIVGNSKVLAHVIPNLVAPIDRKYTFKYLFESDTFQNCLEGEWQLMRKILSEFYYPIASAPKFQDKAKCWMADEANFSWDTSILKVVDNLVIGAMLKNNDAD
jgi:hypothetical protein